ncbi:MAG: hypothetical protein AM324_000820 [Candidatus Thorarchaeota archaeon SMTZ1-83]|nr:MAG: hypothetical protein AM324_01565 [Candidatus Thorarchaeota archaeon SMTZ1-83]
MTTLTIDQLEKWYRKRLSKQSKEFTKKAEKSYKVVERTLKDIRELSRDLKGTDDDEPESIGIATRFAMKVEEVTEDFYVDKEITHGSTEALQDEIRSFIQELWGAGARWIRRMDKKHKRTIKQIDVAMKELMNEMNRLQKLLFEFSWLKDLERIGGRIQTLKDLGYSEELFEEQIRQTRMKIETARNEYESAKKAHDTFTETSDVAGLLTLDEEADHLAGLLRMKMNPLKKQVKKFLQKDTGVRVGAAGQKALLDYFEDSYRAIVEEPDDYPGLLEGLNGLKEAIQTGKLSLKDRLGRRAIEEVEQISSGSLRELQQKAKEVEEKRLAYAGSDVYAESARLQNNLEEAEKNLEYHRSDMLRIRDDISRELSRIEEHKERIESEILESFEEKVTLQLEIRLEPLLKKCVVD